MLTGEDRQFIANHAATSVYTTMGDMVAKNLQLLHQIETVILAGERTALATHIADQSRQILAASNVSQTRVTHKFKPLTTYLKLRGGILTIL